MTTDDLSAARVLESIGHAVIVTSIDRDILAWNPGAEALFGWTADEAIGRTSPQLGMSIAVDDDETILKTLAAGRVWAGDYLARCKDGSTVLVHAVSAPIRDDEGRVVAVVSTSHDVSERRLSEEALREDRQRLRIAFESARMGSWSWDLATGLIEWDEAMEARYGLRAGSFGGTFEEFVSRVHPDDREWVIREIEIAREAGRNLAFEHRVVWPNGSEHWLEARGRPVYDDGTLVGMVGVGIDADERKQLEALMRETSELRATAEIARQLQEAERIARLGSWRWEAATNTATVSAGMAQMLGTPTVLTGAEFAEALNRLAHPDDAPVLEQAGNDALRARQRRYVMEVRFVVDGETRTMVHRGEVVFNGDALVEVRGTFQDVTEQRRAEEALLTTRERLAAERRAVEVLHETLIRPRFPAHASLDFAARYVAAEHDLEVGGDWYDAFALPHGGVMVAVGDVSGHGVDSARLMAKLRHGTRAYACIEHDLSRLLTWLDRFLVQFRDDDTQIATLFVARLDPATGMMSVASAGHPPALLVGERDSEFLAVTPGAPLGADSAPHAYEVSHAELTPGSTLVLYTDGLVERRDESLVSGLERLRVASLPASGARDTKELCERVIQACLADSAREDDVCILAVHRSDPAVT
jgi:PAS domain S-box-containing protein